VAILFMNLTLKGL